MTAAATETPRVGLFARLWTYQAERFPVVKHGALIIAFGASAVCVSALLRGAESVSWFAVLVACVVLFCFFLQLRVADEHKDHAEDSKYRPERPVPRGLVKLSELRGVAFVAAGVQLVLTLSLHTSLLGPLILVWAWMALMTKEFFAPRALKARPILYMVSHMAIMPLIDLYATACDWIPADAAASDKFGPGLAAFLLLSFANGVVLEIARKSWGPEQEREGVETYSRLWGAGRAGVVVATAIIGALTLAAFVHVQSGAGVWFLGGLLLVAMWGAWSAISYADAPSQKSSKQLETAAGVFVLANYLLLGVLPLLERLWLS